MTPRPIGPVTMTRDQRCTACGVAMVRSGAFWDCAKCGRTVHRDEVGASLEVPTGVPVPTGGIVGISSAEVDAFLAEIRE